MRIPIALHRFAAAAAVLVPVAAFAGDDGKPEPKADGKTGTPGAPAATDVAPESYWDLLLEKYDKNKDGVISKAEYTRGEGAFKRLDRNDDGVLTTADMRQRMPPVGPGATGPRVGQPPAPMPPWPRAWSGGGPLAGDDGRPGPDGMRGPGPRFGPDGMRGPRWMDDGGMRGPGGPVVGPRG